MQLAQTADSINRYLVGAVALLGAGFVAVNSTTPDLFSGLVSF